MLMSALRAVSYCEVAALLHHRIEGGSGCFLWAKRMKRILSIAGVFERQGGGTRAAHLVAGNGTGGSGGI